MGDDPQVIVRLARPDDLEAIGRLLPDLAGPLFGERFPGQTVADFCRWKYFGNPAGDAAVGIAVADGEVVSLAAGVPKRVQVGSETVVGFELGDFITAPAFRRRGLFSRLITLVADEAARRGAAFLYVRPNDNSFPILARDLGFSETQRIEIRAYRAPSDVLAQRMRIPEAVARGLGVDRVAERILLPPAPNGIRVEPVERFGPEADVLWSATRQAYSFALVRDRAYLNWRYADSPTPYRLWMASRDGHPMGYAVGFAHQADPMGYLIDAFAAPAESDVAGALLRTCMGSLLEAGARSIYTWVPQTGASSAAARLARRAFPRGMPGHMHVAMRFMGTQLDAGRLPSDGWQLTVGDFDGI